MILSSLLGKRAERHAVEYGQSNRNVKLISNELRLNLSHYLFWLSIAQANDNEEKALSVRRSPLSHRHCPDLVGFLGRIYDFPRGRPKDRQATDECFRGHL